MERGPRGRGRDRGQVHDHHPAAVAPLVHAAIHDRGRDVAQQQAELTAVEHSLPTTFGASNVKPLIDQQLKSTGAPPAKSITCQNVAAKVGNTFTCKVTVADGHVLTDSFRVLKVSATGPPKFSIKGQGVQ